MPELPAPPLGYFGGVASGKILLLCHQAGTGVQWCNHGGSSQLGSDNDRGLAWLDGLNPVKVIVGTPVPQCQ